LSVINQKREDAGVNLALILKPLSDHKHNWFHKFAFLYEFESNFANTTKKNCLDVIKQRINFENIKIKNFKKMKD
jgi:hypothetical protein